MRIRVNNTLTNYKIAKVKANRDELIYTIVGFILVTVAIGIMFLMASTAIDPFYQGITGVQP